MRLRGLLTRALVRINLWIAYRHSKQLLWRIVANGPDRARCVAERIVLMNQIEQWEDYLMAGTGRKRHE